MTKAVFRPDSRFGGVTLRSATLAVALALGACTDAPGDRAVDGTAAATIALAAEPTPTHIDSILPIEEELRRFRATLDEEPLELAGGATDRDRLVLAFVEALERQDTAALAGALLNRAEFAYLYYPHTRFTAPPWELPPSMVWFQITGNGGKGLARLFRTYSGRNLGYRGYGCAAGPRVEGPNRLWEDCTVELAGPDGRTVTKRLFGTILERHGRFKFVSYANDL